MTSMPCSVLFHFFPSSSKSSHCIAVICKERKEQIFTSQNVQIRNVLCTYFALLAAGKEDDQCTL